MRTFFFIPPLPRITGGLAVIYKIASILHNAGSSVFLVAREKNTPGLVQANVPLLDFEDLKLDKNDLWVVPEGWPNALAPGLNAKARCLVYVQNWAYLLSALPEGVKWSQLPVSFLAVSAPVADFIKETTGSSAKILRPFVDTSVFLSNSASHVKNIGKELKIAFMPRKNSAVATIARQIVEARGEIPLALRWLEIHGKTQHEVAAMLKESHIFMGTGFPEGFSLPPLEAMASGSMVVTCSGFGAWDYLRQALPDDFWPKWLGSFNGPSFGQNYKQNLAPNALIVPDADPIALALAVEHAANMLLGNKNEAEQILKNAADTAKAYSIEEHEKAVLALWESLAAG